MKNKIALCLIFCLLLLFCGCSDNIKKETVNNSDAEFMIFDKQYYYLCGIDESLKSIEIYDKIKREANVNDVGYIYEFSFNKTDGFILKTQSNLKRETYLQAISKDGTEINSIELQKDFYSACLYEGKLYTISSFVKEKPFITLEVYNGELSIEYSRKFECDASIIFPQGITVDDEKIYLVCGIMEENASYGEIKNLLFEFDLDFNLLNSIDLELYDGGYQHSYKIENLIYLAKTTDGLDQNKYALGAKSIDIYDLETGILTKDFISLELEYPKYIRYDETNNNIIVLHDRYSLGMNCYSICNLKTRNVISLEFDHNKYGDNSVFFAYKNKNYYFYTPHILSIYNLDSKEIVEYNVDALGLDLLPGIVVLQ